MEETEFEYPIVRRYIASLIDTVLLLILFFMVSALTGAKGVEAALIPVILLVLYCVPFETSKYRGTLGKLWMGVELVDTDGNTVSWWVSLGRIAFPCLIILSVSIFVTNIVRFSSDDWIVMSNLLSRQLSQLLLLGSYLTVFFNKKRKTFWDMMFDTCVIRTKRL